MNVRVALDTVIKVGGGLLGQPGALASVAQALSDVGRRHRLLIVPGGGPFAEAVRELHRQVGLGADTSHWMAILGMDQFAHFLTSRIHGAVLIEQSMQMTPAFDVGIVPVLAPYRWLRDTDPLPHSWDVTSDSIAAWVAGAVGARRLVLIKPTAGDPGRLVDPYFSRALPAGVEYAVLPAAAVPALESLLVKRAS